ncbi:MAG: hypothetical protein KKE20_06875 [Nanoarchaeota archaeon]|nr:hypothetical protein [Nanoarchaeota archaeon]
MAKYEEYAKEDWIQSYAGKWGFLSSSFFGYFHTKLFKEYLGFGPKTVIMIIRKGFSKGNFKKKELEGVSKKLAGILIKDKKTSDEWSSRLKKNADKFRKFMEKEKGKAMSSDKLDQFEKVYSDYYVIHRCVKQVPDQLPPDLLDELLPVLEKARLYSESVFDLFEEFIYSFADAVAKNTGYTKEQITSITREEYWEYLKSGSLPDKKLLEQRYEKTAMIFKNGIPEIILGDEVDELETSLLGSFEGVLKGKSAYPGKVKGTVRLILDPNRVGNFKKGDILVTGMTRPEYLPLMEKAGAVVTDAGGILCHAAIVARELKIPTVIGTEKATKVFKDGDKVLVDADKGIITKS